MSMVHDMLPGTTEVADAGGVCMITREKWVDIASLHHQGLLSIRAISSEYLTAF